MTSKTSNTEVAAIPTKDGHAILGGRPATPELFENMTRQASGLPPKGARQAPAAPVLPEGALLPSIGVARQVLGRHIGELSAEVAQIERTLSRSPGVGATGVQMPYLIDQRRQFQEALLNLREEIERLTGLSDAQVQAWAAEHGRILYR